MSELTDQLRAQAAAALVPSQEAIDAKAREHLAEAKAQLSTDRQSVAEQRAQIDQREQGFAQRSAEIEQAEAELTPVQG